MTEETGLVPPSESFTYKDQVCEIIETLTLDSDDDINRTKQSILKNRFLSEVLNYESRKQHTKKYYDVFRFIVTTGSIMIPAIMSVGQMDPEKLPNHFDEISYWASFFISLSVTISNGFLQLFSIDKNYLEFSLTTEQLKTEGWQFFQLTGKYEDYPDHITAYKPFSKSVENIKRKQVEKEFQGKGDVNKNKKDKEKEKANEQLKKTDEKMDMLLNLVSGGVKNTIGDVRSILTQSVTDTRDAVGQAVGQSISGSTTTGKPPDTEDPQQAKQQAKQQILDEIND